MFGVALEEFPGVVGEVDVLIAQAVEHGRIVGASSRFASCLDAVGRPCQHVKTLHSMGSSSRVLN